MTTLNSRPCFREILCEDKIEMVNRKRKIKNLKYIQSGGKEVKIKNNPLFISIHSFLPSLGEFDLGAKDTTSSKDFYLIHRKKKETPSRELSAKYEVYTIDENLSGDYFYFLFFLRRENEEKEFNFFAAKGDAKKNEITHLLQLEYKFDSESSKIVSKGEGEKETLFIIHGRSKWIRYVEWKLSAEKIKELLYPDAGIKIGLNGIGHMFINQRGDVIVYSRLTFHILTFETKEDGFPELRLVYRSRYEIEGMPRKWQEMAILDPSDRLILVLEFIYREKPSQPSQLIMIFDPGFKLVYIKDPFPILKKFKNKELEDAICDDYGLTFKLFEDYERNFYLSLEVSYKICWGLVNYASFLYEMEIVHSDKVCE